MKTDAGHCSNGCYLTVFTNEALPCLCYQKTFETAGTSEFQGSLHDEQIDGTMHVQLHKQNPPLAASVYNGHLDALDQLLVLQNTLRCQHNVRSRLFRNVTRTIKFVFPAVQQEHTFNKLFSPLLFGPCVQVGDIITVAAGNTTSSAVVESSAAIPLKGYYGIWTGTGRIVVDGVLATAHAAWPAVDTLLSKLPGELPAAHTALAAAL
jgi:hypothetical protein